jgi:hypothetical protein
LYCAGTSAALRGRSRMCRCSTRRRSPGRGTTRSSSPWPGTRRSPGACPSCPSGHDPLVGAPRAASAVGVSVSGTAVCPLLTAARACSGARLGDDGNGTGHGGVPGRHPPAPSRQPLQVLRRRSGHARLRSRHARTLVDLRRQPGRLARPARRLASPSSAVADGGPKDRSPDTQRLRARPWALSARTSQHLNAPGPRMAHT